MIGVPMVIVPGFTALRPRLNGDVLELSCPACGEQFHVNLEGGPGLREINLPHEAGCRFLALVERAERTGRLGPADVALLDQWAAGRRE
jgi:hypothetical protein